MNNPPNNSNDAFRFGLRPVRKLNQAIEALCDSQFNPTARGRLDVMSTDEGGHFAITARNTRNVTGLLVLRGSELVDFKCTTPITGDKFVYLNPLFTNLFAYDFETVTVFQTQGSNHITFESGEDPTRQFTAELFDNNYQTPEGKIEGVPSFGYFCWTDLPSDNMQPLVDQLVWNGILQPVSIAIYENESSIMVGNRHPMIYNLDNMYPNFNGGVRFPWQAHQASFVWSDLEVLLRAARLSPYYSVCFATKLAKHVFFRFTHPQLGELYFLKEAARVTTTNRRYSAVLADYYYVP